MDKKGLLIQYEYCTGCHSCEVACKQENNYPVGIGGIKLEEIITEKNGKIIIDYIPFATRHCDLCAKRTRRGEQPACVKHCQAGIMWYGTIKELNKLQQNKPRSVLISPMFAILS